MAGIREVSAVAMKWTGVSIALAALWLVAGVAPAAEEEPLGLPRVVELALERNPALAAETERRVEFEATVREAKSEIWPEVTAKSRWSRSRNPSLLNSADFDAILDQFPGFEPSEQELWGLSLEVSQLLYSFGKVAAGIELASTAVDAVQQQIEVARLNTAAAAGQSFFRVLEAREQSQALEVQRQAREESLAVVQARFDLGDATRLELLQAEAALAELVPLVDGARGAVATAEVDLRALLDFGAEPLPPLAESRGELPPAPTLERALALAWEQRPELRDLGLQIEALDLQTTVTHADGLPQLEFMGNYGRTVRLLDNLSDPLFADWSVSIGLTWSVFDGGRRKSQVAQIESRRRQLESGLRGLRNQVRREVEGGIRRYTTALSQRTASEVSAEAAREASRVARESYEEGVALQTAWLAAQEREVLAEVRRVADYYRARIQAVELARSLGQLPLAESVAEWSAPPDALMTEAREEER